jgi:hypothetical protein
MAVSSVAIDGRRLGSWHRDGWLLLRGALDAGAVARVSGWIDEVASWAEEDGPGLHHWEQTDHGPALARSEDLVPHHPGLRGLICDELADLAGALLGEPALLFKEKVNYKHPGGAGFAPHQDATAYRFADHHVSCMLPVDPATAASGCLHVASGHHRDGQLPTDARGRVEAEVADALPWEVVEVSPGDLLWFDSYTPHRSEANSTDRARRALYLTYNAASAGDLRATYYTDKATELAASDGTFGGERVRISISDDFLGRPVEGRP